MFRSILVPLDGSSFGEQALPTAVALARPASAHLHVVHVRMLPPGFPHGVQSGGAEGRDPLRDEEGEYLDSATAWARDRLGGSVSFELVEPEEFDALRPRPASSTIAAALEGYVGRHAVDLVVMTTHGRGGLSRAWLGSVADAFVRNASVPTLLLRPGRKESGDDAAAAREGSGAYAFDHVLIPLDGSLGSEQILEPALALGGDAAARYTLVRVVPPAFAVGSPFSPTSVHLDQETLQARKERAEEYLRGVGAELRGRGLEVTDLVLVAASPAQGILDHAAESGADAIAMATRALGGWSRALLGSVADKVVRGASAPVLVLHPREEDEDAAPAD